MGLLKNIIPLLILLCGFSSCADNDADEPESLSDNRLIGISFQMPDLQLSATGSDGYEPGVDYENYIDISADGFRIYLFGSNNKFITRLVPLHISSTAAGNNAGEIYTAIGALPANFPSVSTFKVVVIANWPTYGDDLVAGYSTIDDLCNAEWAKFSRPTDFELSPDNKIPFFGIHEYRNVKLTPGEETTLTEPVTLLRAMAKIELLFNTEGISLTSVGLHGVNSSGYCAPKGVYTHSDYDHNGSWNDDYVSKIHLPGNYNDNGQADIPPVALLRKSPGTDSQPEYRNTDNDDLTSNFKARLQLKMDIDNDGAAAHDIYFAKYDDKGKLIPDTYFDIKRNNCYRFSVTYSHGGLFIKVKKWENAYDNNFIFQ